MGWGGGGRGRETSLKVWYQHSSSPFMSLKTSNFTESAEHEVQVKGINKSAYRDYPTLLTHLRV